MARVRPATAEDHPALLAIFDANTPSSFLPHERADFEADLAEATEYFVLDDGAEVVGGGGVWLGEDGVGGFMWGLITPARQGQGMGRMLAEHRLTRLRKLGAREVRLDTSQHTAPIYARFGFREVKRTPNGYGPSLDRVDMVLALDG